MFLVSTITYPLNQVNTVTAKWQKAVAAPLPSALKRFNVLVAAEGDGIKSLAIYEVTDDKVGEGIRELTRYYIQFYDIPGFKYVLQPMMLAQESIALMPH